MKVDDFKPIGSFIEFTIRPLISELKWLFDEMEKKGIKITEKNFKNTAMMLMRGYLIYSVINFIQSVTVTSIVCYSAWKIICES